MSESEYIVRAHISGMTCGACSGTVQRALRKTEGVASAEVFWATSEARLVVKGERNWAAEIEEKVDMVGFDCRVITVSKKEDERPELEEVLGIRVEGTAEEVEVKLESLRTSLGVASVRKVEFASVNRVPEGVRENLYSVVEVRYNSALQGARNLVEGVKGEWVELKQEESKGMSVGKVHRKVFLRSFPFAVTVLILMYLPSSAREVLFLDAEPFGKGLSIFVLLMILLVTPVQTVIARPFHKKAWKAIERRAANMDLLVSVSTWVAYSYTLIVIIYCLCAHEESMVTTAAGHYFAMSPLLITVVAGGKWLEETAKEKTLSELRSLQDNRGPSTARLGSREVPTQLLHLGDEITLVAGDQVPCDGVILKGKGRFNEALLTGEPTAVEKAEGEKVLAGSWLVSDASLQVEVSAFGRGSLLGQIASEVSEAHNSKAEVQRLADSVASVFVPSVIFLSFLTAVFWMVRVGRGDVDENWNHLLDMGAPGEMLFALRFGMASLMIACPCALGLATPTAVTVGMGLAARKLGILVKSARVLEEAARLRTVIFDKTGTLTVGEPSVVAWKAREGCEKEFWELIEIIEAAGGGSHPMARCLFAEAMKQRTANSPPGREVEECTLRAGRGLVAKVQGNEVRLGNLKLLEEDMFCPINLAGRTRVASKSTSSGSFYDEVENQRKGHLDRGESERTGVEEAEEVDEKQSVSLALWVEEHQGVGSTIALAFRGRFVGVAVVADPLRDDAVDVVKALRGKGLEVLMCSGDESQVCEKIGKALGIPKQNIYSSKLPTEKKNLVVGLSQEGGGVLMVGDGINDASAMAAASVGVAIHSGNSLTTQACDALVLPLCTSHPLWTGVWGLVTLSKSVRWTIYKNFFWAFLYNVLGLPLAMGVFYPAVEISPLLAGVAMSLSSLLVVSTSLLLGRWKLPPPSSPPGSLSLLSKRVEYEELGASPSSSSAALVGKPGNAV